MLEKFCKKNNWKYGKRSKNIENIAENTKNMIKTTKNTQKSCTNSGKQGIIYNNSNFIKNYKPKEKKGKLKIMNKKLIKKVAVASLAALMTIPNITGPINGANIVYAGQVVIAPNQEKLKIYAETGVYGQGGLIYPTFGWIKNGKKDKQGRDIYINSLVLFDDTLEFQEWNKDWLAKWGIDPDTATMSADFMAKNQENLDYIHYLGSMGEQNCLKWANITVNDLYDHNNPLYLRFPSRYEWDTITGKLYDNRTPNGRAEADTSLAPVQRMWNNVEKEGDHYIVWSNNGTIKDYCTADGYSFRTEWYDENGNMIKYIEWGMP